MIYADIILKNGNILSMTEDGKRIRGSAVASAGGKIIACGSDAEINNLQGPETQVIDCRGNTILPGLCDAHCHPSGAVEMSAGCDLFGVYIREGQTADQVVEKYTERLKSYIVQNPDMQIIKGAGWIFGNFSEERLPTRHDLDKICADKPMVLRSFCGHLLWVNTKALVLSGIDENTPDVYAGKIYRGENGYPLGVFKEIEAKKLIEKNLPGYGLSIEEYKQGILDYQRNLANKYGVTMLQDCAYNSNAVEAYKQLAKEGKLTARFRDVYLVEPVGYEEKLKQWVKRKGTDNVDMDFRIDTVKMFAEGPFALLEPYEKSFLEENGFPDDYNGALFWKDEDFAKAAAEAMKAGFNVHIHAMGDKAVKQSVNCLAKAQHQSGAGGRNIIAHLMLIKGEDVELMRQEKIIANLQPRWMAYEGDIAASAKLMGNKRAQACYPQRTFWDHGIKVAYGTDYPVTPPPDTMHEIQCAMTREVFPEITDYELFKGKVLGNEEPATLEEAIQALSINGAYQMMMEKETGSLETGKSADIVLLDSDLERIPVEEIYKVKVVKTIFKGKVVYEKED